MIKIDGGLGFIREETNRTGLYDKQKFLFHYLTNLPEEVQKELGFTYFNAERFKLMIDSALDGNRISGVGIAYDCFIQLITRIEEDEVEELLNSDVIEYFIDKLYVSKRNIQYSMAYYFYEYSRIDKRILTKMIDCIIEKLPNMRSSVITYVFNYLETPQKDFTSNVLSNIFLNKRIYEECKDHPKVLKAIMKQHLKK